VSPLNSTPQGAFLAIARDDEQRVVDARRQAHHADHVDGEHRDVEGLPDQGGERHRDRDGDQAEHDGQARRHDGAEHDEQDDESDGHADALAAL
jgi:hypothetical protein